MKAVFFHFLGENLNSNFAILGADAMLTYLVWSGALWQPWQSGPSCRCNSRSPCSWPRQCGAATGPRSPADQSARWKGKVGELWTQFQILNGNQNFRDKIRQRQSPYSTSFSVIIQHSIALFPNYIFRLFAHYIFHHAFQLDCWSFVIEYSLFNLLVSFINNFNSWHWKSLYIEIFS